MLHLQSVSNNGCEMEVPNLREQSTLVKEDFTVVKVNSSYKCRKRRRPPNLFTLALVTLALLGTGVDCQKIQVTEFNQTSIRDQVTFTLDQSPYLIVDDVIVHRTGHLIVEPGVEVRFMPEAGLTVRGILSAEGKYIFDLKLGYVR
jgi:hypothetical protein